MTPLQDVSERKIRFASNYSPAYLFEKMECIVTKMGFQAQKGNGKVSGCFVCGLSWVYAYRIRILKTVLPFSAAKSDPKLQGTNSFKRLRIITDFC
jgi:hypothetical protein